MRDQHEVFVNLIVYTFSLATTHSLQDRKRRQQITLHGMLQPNRKCTSPVISRMYLSSRFVQRLAV
jgi:hypothetical protein